MSRRAWLARVGAVATIVTVAAGCTVWRNPPTPDPPSGPLFTLADTITVAQAAPESSAIVDLDDDERVDLLIAANDVVYSAVRQPGPALDFGVDRTWASDGNPIKGFGLHDLDGDTRLDPFLTRAGVGTGEGEAGQNLGTGELSFTDLGNDVAVNSRTALFDDFDGDGRLDSLHLGSAFRSNHAWNELHRGISGGRFNPTNQIDTAMPAPFWHQTVDIPATPCDGEEWSNVQTKGGVIRDFDQDGRPDVMLVAYADLGFTDSRCSTEHQTFTATQSYRGVFLLRNTSTPGTIRFADVSKTAIGPAAYCNTLNGCDQFYAPVPFDIDRDGDLDVVLGGLVPPAEDDGAMMRLLRNDTSASGIRFTDITQTSGAFQDLNDLPRTTKRNYRFSDGAPIDVDRDGWIDVAFTNRQDSGVDNGVGYVHVFRNLGSGRFQLLDRATSGIPCYSNSIIAGDLDKDGAIDLVVNDKFFTGKTYIYRGKPPTRPDWVAIDIKEQGSSTWLIGAQVRVYAPDGLLVAMDEVRTDYSYRSKRTPTILATTPGASTVDIEVIVRDGTRHWYRNLPTGRSHELLV